MNVAKIIGAAFAVTLLCGALPAVAQVSRAQPWTTLRATAPLPPPRETGRQKVGDVELYYAIYGKGEPVILLHPGLGHADYWANQVGPLSQEYQVIVLDLRGHGRSGMSNQALSYRLMAQDVLTFIKIRHIEKPAVVGWGDGAVVGLELAMRYPKRIGKLILFGGPYSHEGLQPGVDQKQTFIDYVHKTATDFQRLSPSPAGFNVLVDQLETLWSSEPSYSEDQLRSIKAPTAIIMAEYDEWVVLDHVQKMAELIPNVQVVPMADVSHFAPWQASKKFNDALRILLP